MSVVTIEKAAEHEGQEVTLRGWLYNLRESGKLVEIGPDLSGRSRRRVCVTRRAPLGEEESLAGSFPFERPDDGDRRRAHGSLASAGNGVQVPAIGDALQLVPASIVESNAGAHDEVLYGARHKDFARAGQSTDARSDVHGDPADVFSSELHLTGV